MSAIIKLGDFIPYYDEASRVYPTESVKFQPKTASSGLENEQPVSLMETVFESFLGPRVKADSQPVITNAEWSWSLLSTQEQKIGWPSSDWARDSSLHPSNMPNYIPLLFCIFHVRIFCVRHVQVSNKLI